MRGALAIRYAPSWSYHEVGNAARRRHPGIACDNRARAARCRPSRLLAEALSQTARPGRAKAGGSTKAGAKPAPAKAKRRRPPRRRPRPRQGRSRKAIAELLQRHSARRAHGDPERPGLDRRLQRPGQRRVRRPRDRGREGVPEAQGGKETGVLNQPERAALAAAAKPKQERSAGAWSRTARAARASAFRASSCRSRARTSAARAGRRRAGEYSVESFRIAQPGTTLAGRVRAHEEGASRPQGRIQRDARRISSSSPACRT